MTAARRHYLTILFTDLSDSTRLAGALEAEQYAEVLGAFRRSCREIIPRHGGRIVQLLGDGVLAMFGYPQAHEDGGRRATEAALEMHAAVKSIRLPASAELSDLALHTGIHSGLVLLGQGDTEQGSFELLGTVPNVAARLAEAATRDEILISSETLGPERYFFATGDVRRLSLRGMAAPLAVYSVLARTGVGTRFQARLQRGLVPFVGRLAELDELESHLNATAQQGPRCVAIVGAAGLGKTRLAEEFLALASQKNWRVCRGYCESYLGAEPMQPFLQMLRSLQTPPSAAARHNADEGAAPTLLATLEHLAATGPLALFIDDWQWADAVTRQMFRSLITLTNRPMLLLVATRERAGGDPDLSGAHLIELEPFNWDEAATATAHLLRGTNPFVTEEIYRYSGGNPLFIEELCHSAADERAGESLDGIYRGAAWLETLIESRLARLQREEADLVRAAAVIGNVIPGWLFQSVTGYAIEHPLIHALAEQDFVFAGLNAGTLRFKHGITHDAVYKAVGLAERRALHLRVASCTQEYARSSSEEPFYESLAYHYAAAEDDAQAARYAELAGDKAMAASALDRAQTQYRAALKALDRLPASDDNERRWMKLAERFALACVFDPAREPLVVLRKAAERAAVRNDAAAIAHMEYWLGYLNYGLGESQATIRHCERALAAVASLDDQRLLVQIRATLGQALAAACDYTRAAPLLDEAIAIKRHFRTGTRPAVGLSYTLTCKAALLADRGDFAAADECFEDAIEAVRGANHEVEGSLFGWRSAVSLWQGQWEQARAHAARSQEVAARVRSVYLFVMSRAVSAYADWCQSRDAGALQTMTEATAWLQAREREQYISLNYGWLTEACADCGRSNDARNHAARAFLRGRKRDLLGQPMACRALARMALRASDHVTAQRYVDLSMDAARARESRHEIASTVLCQGEVAAAAQRLADARGAIERAIDEFNAMQMHWHVRQALQALARL
jgi:class 3 adenylate cyclase/tetratricopeptide (TPR) repeat protein